MKTTLFACVLSLLLSATSMAEAIRILPLGDSITQGGRNDREEYTYRFPLFRMLTEAGYDVDFVGSLKGGLHGDAKWPALAGKPFDPDHEGHYGWKTAAVRDKLAGWLKAYPAAPDIVLIHLGTNDQGAANAATTKSADDPSQNHHRRKAAARALRCRHHSAVHRHGRHAPREEPQRGRPGRPPELQRRRRHPHPQAGRGDGAKAQHRGSPVITVHHYKGWLENPGVPNTDTFDWAHPNPKGQEKMAANWLEAMKPYLDPLQKRPTVAK